MDVETAKTILNFGDDYRNFIESNSEVQSPRFVELEKRTKNSRSKVGFCFDDSMLIVGRLMNIVLSSLKIKEAS